MSASYIPPPSLPLAGGTMNPGAVVNMDAGSASAPSLTLGNSQTGWYKSGSNQIGIAISGVSSFSFKNTGFTQSIAGAASNVTVLGDTTQVAFNFSRYSNDTTSPFINMGKGRGTIASPAAIATNDDMGLYIFGFGDSGGTVREAIRLEGVYIDTNTPGANARGGRFIMSGRAIGSGALTEWYRFDQATGLSMFGTNPVIDANRVFRDRLFTVATLPAGTNGMGTMVSDALGPTFGAAVVGGGAVIIPVYYDGAWKVG